MNFADTVATSRHFILSLVMQQWFLSISLPNTIYSQDSTHAVHACNWMYFLKTIAKKNMFSLEVGAIKRFLADESHPNRSMNLLG